MQPVHLNVLLKQFKLSILIRLLSERFIEVREVVAVLVTASKKVKQTNKKHVVCIQMFMNLFGSNLG